MRYPRCSAAKWLQYCPEHCLCNQGNNEGCTLKPMLDAHGDSSSARDPNEPSRWPARPASSPVFRPITKPLSLITNNII
jgi:hypothetical protein